MLDLSLSKDAASFISGRPPKHQRQIASKFQELRLDPLPTDSISLKGSVEFKRVDCGEYRIIYRFDAETLYVAIIGKRNDDEVYRRFARK